MRFSRKLVRFRHFLITPIFSHLYFLMSSILEDLPGLLDFCGTIGFFMKFGLDL